MARKTTKTDDRVSVRIAGTMAGPNGVYASGSIVNMPRDRAEELVAAHGGVIVETDSGGPAAELRRLDDGDTIETTDKAGGGGVAKKG